MTGQSLVRPHLLAISFLQPNSPRLLKACLSAEVTSTSMDYGHRNKSCQQYLARIFKVLFHCRKEKCRHLTSLHAITHYVSFSLQTFSDKSLNYFRCHGIQTRFRATTSLVSFVVGSVACHLTHRTSRTPKRAAAVFATIAALFRNLVLVTNIGTRAHHNNKEENRV